MKNLYIKSKIKINKNLIKKMLDFFKKFVILSIENK